MSELHVGSTVWMDVYPSGWQLCMLLAKFYLVNELHPQYRYVWLLPTGRLFSLAGSSSSSFVDMPSYIRELK